MTLADLDWRVCLAVAAALAEFALFLWLYGRIPQLGKAPRSLHAILAALTVAVTTIGGTKRPMVNDPYIMDDGSYMTNDVVHVAIAKRTPLLPDDTDILVFAREIGLTNAADWLRLDPHLTFADHPYDYALANATNYEVMVAASYVPPPSVHTNGVWSIAGFAIPGEVGRFGFKQSTITLIPQEDNQ